MVKHSWIRVLYATLDRVIKPPISVYYLPYNLVQLVLRLPQFIPLSKRPSNSYGFRIYEPPDSHFSSIIYAHFICCITESTSERRTSENLRASNKYEMHKQNMKRSKTVIRRPWYKRSLSPLLKTKRFVSCLGDFNNMLLSLLPWLTPWVPCAMSGCDPIAQRSSDDGWWIRPSSMEARRTCVQCHWEGS